VKPYTELSQRGQLRRLRGLALKALLDYDLDIQWVRFLTIATNTMFHLRTESGDRYVLRIYSDEETTLVENQAEMFWLQALKRDTGLKVSEPVPRRDGGMITTIKVPGVPVEKRCVLFKWVPGRALGNHLNPQNYWKLGQTIAGLHNHAESLRPLPLGIKPKRWDKVFYYPDEPVIYNIQEYRHLFPPDRIDLLNRVIERATEVFEALFANPNEQIMIHGDIHYWNVHVYQGELYMIDFEDIMLGYPIQDLAITLYYGRDRKDYEALRTALQAGYASLRTWPESGNGQIETLMAARSVNFINYVARIDPSPQVYLQQRCQELERYLAG
jgi:Ser/Thr protein kinase RdoA (MazF antagonist)